MVGFRQSLNFVGQRFDAGSKVLGGKGCGGTCHRIDLIGDDIQSVFDAADQNLFARIAAIAPEVAIARLISSRR